MPRIALTRVSAAGLVALLVYATGTVFFTARTTGDTVDEPSYREAGSLYLRERNFKINRDHPPLSKELGAIYPEAAGNRDLVAYRYGHAVFYGLGGLGLALALLLSGYAWAAWIFAGLYALCPNLKSMAALQITDFDVALLSAITAFLLWRSRSRGKSERRVFVSFFALGLSACAKMTGLFYLPFLAVDAFDRAIPGRERRRWGSIAFAGFLLAVLFTYQFYLPGLRWFGSAFIFQVHHNSAGHPGFLFGRISNTGFWYFYLALLVMKLPLLSLMTTAAGTALAIVRPKASRGLWLPFFAPAVVLLIVLSAGRIHIGFRYYLPGLLLFYLGAALALDDALRGAGPRVRRAFAAAGMSALALGIVLDLRTVREDAYIAFFNLLAPVPTTRNFADSNNDWGQGLPRHLRQKFPRLTALEELSLIETLGRREAAHLLVGATALSGMLSREAPGLRRFRPLASLAGYEVHKLSPEEVFDVLRESDHPGESLPPCAPSISLEVAGWVSADGNVRLREDREHLLIVSSSRPPVVHGAKAGPPIPQVTVEGRQEWRVWIFVANTPGSERAPRSRTIRVETTSPPGVASPAGVVIWKPSCVSLLP